MKRTVKISFVNIIVFLLLLFNFNFYNIFRKIRNSRPFLLYNDRLSCFEYLLISFYVIFLHFFIISSVI